MITVKQRHDVGRCVKMVTIGVFTDDEFGYYYRPRNIVDLFSTDCNQLDHTQPTVFINNGNYVTNKVYKYVAYDDNDQIIVVNQLIEIVNYYYEQRKAAVRKKLKRTPGRKPSRYKGYRHPKTIQEIRKSYDHPELVRKKRNAVALPTWWDNIHINYQRNWKKYRKTQWKSK